MQSIPKIVRDRLQTTAAAGAHPDADLLTAFAEKSLPDRERSTLLQHLARCSDCRDILALALPPVEAIEPQPLPVRRGWLTWPVLRWGFVAVGAVAIASFVIVQQQHKGDLAVAVKDSKAPVLEAKNQEAGNRETHDQKAANKPAASAPTRKADLQASEDDKVGRIPHAPALTVPRPAPAAPTRGEARLAANFDAPTGGNAFHGSAFGGAAGGPIHSAAGANVVHPGPNAQFFQQQAQSQVQTQQAQATPVVNGKQTTTLASAPPPVPVPQMTEAVEVAAAAPAVEASEAQLQGEDAAKVSKTKPVTTLVQVTGATAPVPLEQQPPRWTISSAGVLQRSFDQGKSWQDVDVNANFSHGATQIASRAVAAEISPGGIKPALKKAPTQLFRAVTATGADVWAGGTSAMLYHSADAGATWARVVPSANGTPLKGDIVSLEFSDAQHGKITTSTPETWLTADAGNTWQKQ